MKIADTFCKHLNYITAKRVLCRRPQQFSINMWAGIAGDCFVVPDVLPHRLAGNHYRHFLLHDLPKLLEIVPLAEHECSTCNIVLRHILAVPCEILSITPITTD
jgi:hypothetical protein